MSNFIEEVLVMILGNLPLTFITWYFYSKLSTKKPKFVLLRDDIKNYLFKKDQSQTINYRLKIRNKSNNLAKNVKANIYFDDDQNFEIPLCWTHNGIEINIQPKSNALLDFFEIEKKINNILISSNINDKKLLSCLKEHNKFKIVISCDEGTILKISAKFEVDFKKIPFEPINVEIIKL